jgi:adenosylcobinamide kinase/adenosylcobinamide-phosphate guanylyltransferase
VKPKRILVTGGARSGKSRFAESLVEGQEAPLVYLATAQAFDAEMRERIRLHRERRDTRWTTLEAPLDLAQALGAQGRPEGFILVDCVTLWLSNMMLAERYGETASAALIDAFRDSLGTVVLVTNEVGQGIVPENALARRFRDEAGILNQRLAEVADEVHAVMAGLPLRLKG